MGKRMAKKIVITLFFLIALIILFTDYGKEIEKVLFSKEAIVEKKIEPLPSASENTQSAEIEAYYPLKQIKIRHYTSIHSTRGKAVFILTTLPKRELNGKTVTPLKMDHVTEHGVSNLYTIFVVSGSEGTYYLAIQAAKAKEPKIYPPIYYFKKPIKVGNEWKSGPTTGIIESVDDDVSVPAGTFHHCLRVKTTYPNQTKTEWFAPEVGSVKFIFNLSDSSYSTTELEKYE
ncbi:MAG: hypothetical protein ACHQ2F_05325 [Desulfobaccales bacterium]